MTAVPVVMPGKVPVCMLCRRQANEASPLSSATNSDMYGGYVPWFNYTKVRSPDGAVIAKKPTGTMCLISRNVYKMIGYGTKYGPPGKYKKVTLASKDAKHMHAAFVAAEKECIRYHGENPAMPNSKTNDG